MKKKEILLGLTMAVMIISACQQAPKTIPVDIAGEKAAIQKVIDAHFNYIDSDNLDIAYPTN